MTTYRTRPIHTYQHPLDVLNDVMAALNEAARNYGLPMSFGLSCESVTTQDDGPSAEPAISFICHYGDDLGLDDSLPDRVCNAPDGVCESCQ